MFAPWLVVLMINGQFLRFSRCPSADETSSILCVVEILVFLGRDSVCLSDSSVMVNLPYPSLLDVVMLSTTWSWVRLPVLIRKFSDGCYT